MWRKPANYAAGGVIIVNDSGEKIFLPVSGIRTPDDGTLYYTGATAETFYWSSSSLNGAQPNMPYNLHLDSNSVIIDRIGNSAFGFPMLCVAE